MAAGYTVRHFTDENGLPQNSINDLLFDDQGYLWLGSQVGLVRFNGFSFKLYYPDDKPIMESNVKLLGRNSRGNIYFQTEDHNLYSYPGNNSHRLSPVNSWDLADPRLLNATKQLFDFSRFLHPSPSAGTREKQKRTRIFRDLFQHNTNFYATDSVHAYLLYNDTLFYYDGNDLRQLPRHEEKKPIYLVQDQTFYMLGNGAILGAYRQGRAIPVTGPIHGDLQTDSKRSPVSYRLFSSANTTHLLADSRLYRIVMDSRGGLTSEFLLDLDFISDISAVEYNKELDLLLIATGTNGFYSLRKSRFLTPRFPPALQNQLSRHLFGPMTLLDDKTVLTDKFLFDTTGNFQQTDLSPGTWFKCLYKSPKNGLIWSAIHNLPRRMTADLKDIKVYPTLDAKIIDYNEDGNGSLYCLTQQSIWMLDQKGFRRISPSQPALKGVNESFCCIASNRFLIANTAGLMEYDCSTGQQRIIPMFNGAHVRAIYQCRDSSVLIGTYGQGYFYLHGNRFYRMPLDRNGFLITAHCFLEDSKGNIWIPCNKGLFRVPKADLDAWCKSEDGQIFYYYYGRQDGLPTNEFNGGFNACGLITRNDFVTLLSMHGIICYYTDSLKADFPKGKMHLTNIEIDGQAVTKCDSIILPPDYNSLLLEVSSPYLGNRANLCMDYRLKGLDMGWKSIPDDGLINLSRLGPGQYTLEARKVSGFGKDNYCYREWPVTVIPRFYSTAWFKALAALSLIVLILLLVQLSLKLKEKRKEVRIKAEKLEGTISTLKETVAKLQDSEKALLDTSRLREKLISLVIHDLRSPLRFLTMLAGDLHDNQDKLSAAEMKERSYWVKKGTNDIYHFSEDFLLWVTSQKDNFSIARSHVSLQPLLQEIYEFFKEQVLQKGNTMTIDAPDDLSIYSDPHILLTIIRNLVDNANKYTDRGSIMISAEKKESYILIAVADTGKGMSPQQIERFFHNESLDNIQTGSQLGHKFIFDLTNRIDGSVSIESQLGKGTTVSIKLTSI